MCKKRAIPQRLEAGPGTGNGLAVRVKLKVRLSIPETLIMSLADQPDGQESSLSETKDGVSSMIVVMMLLGVLLQDADGARVTQGTSAADQITLRDGPWSRGWSLRPRMEREVRWSSSSAAPGLTSM